MADSLITSLVSWWSLDEASGNAIDAHGTNHLTDVNTVGSAVGKVGNARSFSRSAGEKFTLADNPSLSMGVGVQWTVSAWVNAASVGPDSTNVIFSKGVAAEYYLDVLTAGRFPRLLTGGVVRVTSTTPINLDQWHLLFWWYDGTTYHLSVDNGPPNSGGSGSTPDGVGIFQLGGRSDAAANYLWNGLIDEAAIWKRALTADERSRLYNGGAGIGYADLLPTGPVLRSPHAINYLDPSAVLSSPFLIGSLR